MSPVTTTVRFRSEKFRPLRPESEPSISAIEWFRTGKKGQEEEISNEPRR